MKGGKPVKAAFNRLLEEQIVKHVRSVIWVLVETTPVVKFVPYYRHNAPHKAMQDEILHRCIRGQQPRTFYIAKGCRSTDGQVYLANPEEISFTRSKFSSPIKPEIDETYTVSEYLKDSLRFITHNKDHFITDLMAFRCSDKPFSNEEMAKLFSYEGLLDLTAKWEQKEDA